MRYRIFKLMLQAKLLSTTMTQKEQEHETINLL